jgi:hypothetical protein
VLRSCPRSRRPSTRPCTWSSTVSNYRVKESIIVDAAGNKNHFRFYEPSFGAAIEDASFQFSEKSPKVKAFRVIDGDQEADKQNAPPSAPTTPTP